MKSLKDRRSHRKKNSEDHSLPLINVVFLLLIFFMVAGQLARSDPFKMTPATSLSTTGIDQNQMVIHLDADGTLALNHAVLPLDDLLEQVKNNQEDTGVTTVRLKTDASTDARPVLTLMTQLRDAGVEKIHLITQQEATQ